MEENRIVHASQGQTSTNYQDTSVNADSEHGLWHLDRVDQRQIYDRSLDGEYAWCHGGLGVRAYVVDTGIRADHAEFEGRVVAGFDATLDPDGNPTADGTATDPCVPNRSQQDGQGYHGTAVASLLGGRNLGVAKNVNLVSVRMLGCDASGQLEDVVEGLNWIMSDPDRGNSPAVINMSFWVVGEAQPQSLRDSLDELEAAGFAIFVSANNHNENACNKAPASFARGNSGAVVSVGGTQVGLNGDGLSTYQLRDFRWPSSSFGNCVDIWAPAHGMRSADYHTPDGTTTARSGTSFSSPIVAGIAARYLESRPINPQTGQPTKPAEVWNWLASNATSLMSDDTTPLIQGVQTTPHTRMVFFDEGCRNRPVTPGCVPLAITKQADSWKLPNTTQVTLSVGVNATAPSFQWFRGVRGDVSQPIAGAVYSSYTIEPVNNQSGSYWVRVSDTCNSVLYSETATITHVLFCPAINIIQQPAPSTTINEGGSAALAVVASSDNPLSFQWEWRNSPYSQWSPVYYATNPSLTVTPYEPTFYRVRIRNGCGERYSEVAWVNVLPLPKEHTVAFRTYYWNFVGAENGGGAGVNATAGAAYEWEHFVLRDLNGGDLMDGDLVTLRTYNGHYLVTEWCGGPGQTVNADRTSPGEWETFQIRNMDGGSWIHSGSHVALKACSGNGYYVVAEYGGLNGGGPGAGEVNCDRTDAGPWETFEMLSQ